ncbi:MAG: hypothetical protein FVQ80_12310 [Planctomycetes bacterium]|nr:hypothetical protein [Planctomycetota bacterium]
MKKFSMLFLILAIAMVMTGVAQANYLTNPGLEIGDSDPNYWQDPCYPEPNAWSFWAEYEAIAVGPSTASYIEGDAAGAHGGEDYAMLDVYSYGRTFVFQQRFAAEDIAYTLKTWVKGFASSPPASARIKIEFYDWDNLIYEEIKDVAVTGTWAQYTNDSNGLTKAPIGTRRITSTGGNISDYTVIYYDDFELTSDPVYASLDDCQKTQFQDQFDFDAGDLTRDCLNDLRDIALLGLYWTRCNAQDCPDYGHGY